MEICGLEAGAVEAAGQRRGLFERAQGGTVFLQQIGTLPWPLQVRLLRILEDGAVTRVGGETPLALDARLIAGASEDVEPAMQQGRFHAGLYYLLAAVTLVLPPLRRRREDILVLIDRLLPSVCARWEKPLPRIRPEALALLIDHDYPGNERELLHILERAVLVDTDGQIGDEDLPEAVVTRSLAASSFAIAHGDSARDQAGRITSAIPLRVARREEMRRFEKAYLESLLAATGGRIGESSRRAGINERSLYELMRRHGLAKEAFKRPGGRPLENGS
jgi:DNA-binding NtrC family response regulator